MSDFTHLAQEALQKAQEIQDKNHDGELTSLHLACGVLRLGFDLLDPSLRDCGVNPIAFTEDLEEAVGRLPRVGGFAALKEDNISHDVRRVLRGAEAIAGEMGDTFVTLEHLLLALVDRAEMFELKSV